MQFNGKTFSQSDEVLDGNQYHNCTFEGCRIIYRGGELPLIEGTNFMDCFFRFEDAAERTANLMRNIYHGMGPQGAQMIELTMDWIRQPPE